MTYSAFNAAKPAGSETGSAVPQSANVNDCALWDASLMLATKGFDWSITAGTGTTVRPQYIFLKNGTRWVRGTCTWGTAGGQKYNPTQIVWELSTNSGAIYDTIATQTFTYDTNGYPTATSGAGSFGVMFMSLLGHFWRLKDDYAAHAGATGTAVHGLGAMSTQEPGAIWISGGTIDEVEFGGISGGACKGLVICLQEQFSVRTAASPNAPIGLDWAAGGSVVVTNGTNALTFSDAAPAGPTPGARLTTHLLRVDHFENCIFSGLLSTANWGAAGVPSLTGPAEIMLWTRNVGVPSDTYASVVWN